MTKHKRNIELSIVIPLFNEELRFPKSFKKIDTYFKRLKFTKEYILVDDGSRDKTLAIVSKVKSSIPITIIKTSKNQGKGGALKKGILASNGKNIFFTDIDLSTPITEFSKLYMHLKDNHIVVGSRRLQNSTVSVKQPYHRRILGRIFYTIFSMFFTRGVKDTNCGFKCFRGQEAKKLFKKMTNKRWGFDAEILYVAERWGYKIKEIPVTWLNDPNSRVSSLKASVNTVIELVRIKVNEAQGKYGKLVKKKESAVYVLINELTKITIKLFFAIIFKFSKPDKNKAAQKVVNLYGAQGDFEQLFTKIRLWDSPYDKLFKYIPQKGQVVDLGSGDGFLVNYLAVSRPKTKFLGIELNEKRQILSNKGLKNTQFIHGDVLKTRFPDSDVITIVHVLHHLPSLKDQEVMLKKVYKKLKRNGKLIIIEIVEKPVMKYFFTWLVDAIVVPILFERKLFSTDFYYRKSEDWRQLLKKIGFSVKSIPVDQGKVFSHLLLVATK